MWSERLSELVDEREPAEGASNDQLVQAEHDLGLKLPGELRSLLAETNGVVAKLGVKIIWRTQEIVANNLELRNKNIFRDQYMPFDGMLFFGDDGGCGHFAFVLRANPMGSSPIFEWNDETDDRLWIAPNLRAYLVWWAKRMKG